MLAERIPGTAETRLALTLFATPLCPGTINAPATPSSALSKGLVVAVTATLVLVVLLLIGPGPPALGRGKAFFIGTALNEAELMLFPSVVLKRGKAELLSSPVVGAAVVLVLVLLVTLSGGRLSVGATGLIATQGEVLEISPSSPNVVFCSSSRRGQSVDPALDALLCFRLSTGVLLVPVAIEVDRGKGFDAILCC